MPRSANTESDGNELPRKKASPPPAPLPVVVGELTHIGIVQHGFVREVSFPVQRGAVTFLFGPNNSGKSTILDAVRSLGGGVRREPSWVVAYARDSTVLPEAFLGKPWMGRWGVDIDDDVDAWFLETNYDPDGEVRGWLRMLPALHRDPLDESLGAEARTCFSTAWGPRIGDESGLVAWEGIEPDPLATPTRGILFQEGLSMLSLRVPGDELVSFGGGDVMLGPPAAMEAMPESLLRDIEAWSDEFTRWDMDRDGEWGDERPPVLPGLAFFAEGAPVSWLVNPSRLIPTMDSLIGPVESPFDVITADTSFANSASWPPSSVAFLDRAIDRAAWRLNREGVIPPARLEQLSLGFHYRGGRLRPHPVLDHVLPVVAERATALIPEFARHSATSRFVLEPDAESGTLEFAIEAKTGGVTRRLKLSDLAEGLRIWHALAIRLALTPTGLAPVAMTAADPNATWSADDLSILSTNCSIVILDEPERHLHPGAQREAARWLAEFAEKTQSYVIAATHSPAFLSSGHGRFLHVERQPGDEIAICELAPSELRRHFSTDRGLGFDRGEILSFCDQYLVVEGEHEQIILETWFPDELSRTLICPMRGTNRTESVNLQLEALMRVVRMPVGFLVDDDPVIRGVVQIADAMQDIPPGRARIEYAREYVPGFKEKRHKSWLDVLFFDHVPWTSPIEVISEPDIIFYLDEELIGQGSARPYSHAAGRTAIADERSSNQGIKPFLEGHFGLRSGVFDDDEIRLMARTSTQYGRAALRAHINHLITDQNPSIKE